MTGTFRSLVAGVTPSPARIPAAIGKVGKNR
jgi:hypothetical protein